MITTNSMRSTCNRHTHHRILDTLRVILETSLSVNQFQWCWQPNLQRPRKQKSRSNNVPWLRIFICL